MHLLGSRFGPRDRRRVGAMATQDHRQTGTSYTVSNGTERRASSDTRSVAQRKLRGEGRAKTAVLCRDHAVYKAQPLADRSAARRLLAPVPAPGLWES